MDGQTGVVRVAGKSIFMDSVVAAVLVSLQAEYPEIRLPQSDDFPGKVIGKLQNGTLDVGILSVRASDVPSEFAVAKILKGRTAVACRIGHPLARKSHVQMSDIAQLSWIAAPPESSLYHGLRAALTGIGATEFKVGFSGRSLTSEINILSNSDTLTVLPHSVVSMHRHHKTLATLRIPSGGSEGNLGLVMPKTGQAGPAPRRLMHFVETEHRSLERVFQKGDDTRNETGSA